MSLTRARIILVYIFLIFFVTQIISIISVYWKGEIYPDEMLKILIKLLGVYSVHFAIIVGGIFGQHASPENKAPKYTFWIALLLSIIWNALLFWRAIFFFIRINDTSVDLLDYMDNISLSSSFLVAGALSFFFARR